MIMPLTITNIEKVVGKYLNMTPNVRYGITMRSVDIADTGYWLHIILSDIIRLDQKEYDLILCRKPNYNGFYELYLMGWHAATVRIMTLAQLNSYRSFCIEIKNVIRAYYELLKK